MAKRVQKKVGNGLRAVKQMSGLARLKRLVTVLERVQADPVKKREFDMGTWATKTPDCGTHLCACGWAASDPVLHRQGLGFGGFEATWFDKSTKVAELTYEGLGGFDAAAEFFGIGSSDAWHLFDPAEYASITAMAPVIKRVKAQIAKMEGK